MKKLSVILYLLASSVCFGQTTTQRISALERKQKIFTMSLDSLRKRITTLEKQSTPVTINLANLGVTLFRNSDSTSAFVRSLTQKGVGWYINPNGDIIIKSRP